MDVIKAIAKRGEVFALQMGPSQGITPKNGYSSRRKYFIVLGYDAEGYVYGGVVFNSGVNQTLPEVVQLYHIPIDADMYPFLSHDSFVNCSSIKKVRPDDLLNGKLIGTMMEFDMILIIEALKDCPLVSKIELQQIGITK